MAVTTTRNIPDECPKVTFCETDPKKIANNLITKYEVITKRTLYPADPVRIFILWMADIFSQERELINYSARMNISRYAVGDFLDLLAEFFHNIYRLPPESAMCILHFELSMAQEEDYIISQPIQVTPDGEIIFQTIEPIIFPAGQDYVDVPAVCLTAGTVGNGFVPGQISKMVNEQFLYFKEVRNITESKGGAEQEGDADFYNRMRESAESFSTAGPMNGYIYHAKSVSSAISDVVATTPEAGVVDIRVLLQGGEQPAEEFLKKMEAALSANDVRPMNDFVTISAPEEDLFEIDLTFYVQQGSATSAEVVEKEIKAAVEKYISWQTERMGRDINPSYLIQLVMNAGAKRVEVRKPVFQSVDETHIAKIKRETIVIKNGGAEDE